MSERLRTLVGQESSGDIRSAEKAEIGEYEQLKHLMVMIKSGGLSYITGARVT
jgi:hypothetical protein